MYELLTLLTGIILSIMVSINGSLSNIYGAFLAAIIIHIIGSIFAAILCFFQKNKQQLFGHTPSWLYLGGVIGVFTTLFNNMAYGHISMTSIVALGLLGQSITAISIDCFGLFGMKQHPFKRKHLIGFSFAFLGIFCMFDKSITASLFAVIISLLAGTTVVLSRTVNARLSHYTGALRSSFINHIVGLPCTIIIFLLFGQHTVPTLTIATVNPFLYLGGFLGVTVVLLCNLSVPKLPAFKLTLLTFLGQVFTGVFLDFLMGNISLNSSFLGGIIIALGMGMNMIFDIKNRL